MRPIIWSRLFEDLTLEIETDRADIMGVTPPFDHLAGLVQELGAELLNWSGDNGYKNTL
jgi:hypothetical protein